MVGWSLAASNNGMKQTRGRWRSGGGSWSAHSAVRLSSTSALEGRAPRSLSLVLGGLEVERGRRRVAAAVVITILVITCLIACYLAIPRNRFYIFPRANGGTVTISREGIEFEPRPDR